MARRFVLALLSAGCLSAQVVLPPPPPEAPPPKYADPPEADQSLSTSTVYTFNPLQAKKEIQVGDFNIHKGNLKGAALRYREATMWDDGNSDAFYKYADVSEKLKDYGAAREAFTKYAELNPKKADEIKKRIAKYPKDAEPPKSGGPVTLDEALKNDRGTDGTLRSKGIIRR